MIRRLEHPERANWLLYPNGEQYQAPNNEPPDDAELATYARVWDRWEAIRDFEARVALSQSIDAKWETERRHLAVEGMRDTLSGPADRVLDRLKASPQHYAVWWERVEAWLKQHPPSAAYGSIGDPERKIDEYDVYLSEQATIRGLRKKGRPKGLKHSRETIEKITEIRRSREAAGTWGRRGRTLRKQFERPSYEDLGKGAGIE